MGTIKIYFFTNIYKLIIIAMTLKIIDSFGFMFKAAERWCHKSPKWQKI